MQGVIRDHDDCCMIRGCRQSHENASRDIISNFKKKSYTVFKWSLCRYNSKDNPSILCRSNTLLTIKFIIQVLLYILEYNLIVYIFVLQSQWISSGQQVARTWFIMPFYKHEQLNGGCKALPALHIPLYIDYEEQTADILCLWGFKYHSTSTESDLLLFSGSVI